MSTQSKVRWSLSSLVFLITIAAILAGWYVDHQGLITQIDPPQDKLSGVYRLTESVASDVEAKLVVLYPEQTLISDTVSNSLLVVADRNVYDQIQLMVNYIEKINSLEAR